MNSVNLMGRLTADPKITKQGETTIAKYTLAIDRPAGREKEKKSDFIPCTAFGNTAEFCEKYLKKGIKIAVSGAIHTDKYEKEGKMVYTMEVIAHRHYFAEKSTNLKDEIPLPDEYENLDESFFNGEL